MIIEFNHCSVISNIIYNKGILPKIMLFILVKKMEILVKFSWKVVVLEVVFFVFFKIYIYIYSLFFFKYNFYLDSDRKMEVKLPALRKL